MKQVILGDKDQTAYLCAVPDKAASELYACCHRYTTECSGENLSVNGFIGYLNRIFTDEQSSVIQKLADAADDPICCYGTLPQFWF